MCTHRLLQLKAIYVFQFNTLYSNNLMITLYKNKNDIIENNRLCGTRLKTIYLFGIAFVKQDVVSSKELHE